MIGDRAPGLVVGQDHRAVRRPVNAVDAEAELPRTAVRERQRGRPLELRAERGRVLLLKGGPRQLEERTHALDQRRDEAGKADATLVELGLRGAAQEPFIGQMVQNIGLVSPQPARCGWYGRGVSCQ